IAAGKAVAKAIRTTLGPQGMDKMLVDSMGDVVITNDGLTILEEMEIEHPAAKMMVEIAKTQDKEAGDGTTTAVILAGELLKMAEDLIDQDVHPTTIVEGYRMARKRAEEILIETSFEVNLGDTQLLKNIAATAMTGKGAETVKERLSSLIVEAVEMSADDQGKIDARDIKIEKMVGGSAEDSMIIRGIVLDKERLHPLMPDTVPDAKILLLNAAIEFKAIETDAEISITHPDQIQAFVEKEEEIEKALVDRIIGSGANIVFCQKGIDEFAGHHLAKAGILAVRRLKKSDMEKLSEMTGATIISSPDAISGDDLGFAGKVEAKRLSGTYMIVVSECKNKEAVSLLMKGGSSHTVDETIRAVEDGVRGVCVALEDNRFVAGGGASEIELSRRLRKVGSDVGGRAQLAIEAYADAFLTVPRTLAENAGLDQIEMLALLRTAHEQEGRTNGIDLDTATPIDMKEAGVIEPLRVKMQAISSATEAAMMILRIDEIIAASGAGGMPSEEEMAAMQAMGGMGGGMPGGMGGMPGMM
ncbi:thermosome subunit alpha, partial [Methanocalculus sp.]|uniref:thermosome subunit alpha n=1 Tax=Methanocalculus sp. TaxID=2004547 RepID=UPI00262E926A